MYNIKFYIIVHMLRNDRMIIPNYYCSVNMLTDVGHTSDPFISV